MLDTKYRIEIANEQSRQIETDSLVSIVSLILAEYRIESAEISIALVDDPAMRELNRLYLNHDYETDVLSFLLEDDSERAHLAGQLIVSTDTAQRLADELKLPLAAELLLYVVHGTLHLLGLDDTTPELAIEMRAAEREYLSRCGIEYQRPQDEAE